MGPVCGFLVFWLQNIVEPFALFHHKAFEYMHFTVMFHILEDSYDDGTCICNLDLQKY